MENETVFSLPHPWFTAEGIENEKPCLFRGRQIPDRFIGDPSLSNIFVITVLFDVTDSTGLPTKVQYRMIEEFERQCIDSIEARQLGVVAFIKTFNGVVRYFLYVSDIDAASNAMTDPKSTHFSTEVAGGNDPKWSEYKAFLHGMHRN